MKNENNIVAIYIRVSTDSQTEFSPDAQLKAIKKYAKLHNYEIDSKYIFKDIGISGRKAEKRPEFMRMIATAKTKPHSPFSKILVHKFDRFARNREDSIVYKSLLRKECKVDVVSITEDFGEDKFSVILESMLEAMAEYYSLNLSDEVLKGMTEKANRGEIQTQAPYGYYIQNGKLFIKEELREIIKTIYTKFDLGTPVRQITQYLNDLNILTSLGNKFENRTVEYILKNPIYKGYVLWCPGAYDSHNFDLRKEKGIMKKGDFEPIIDEELYNRVQSKFKANKEKYKYIKSNQTTDWLRKLVKCSSCGQTMTFSKDGLQCIGYSHGTCKDSHYISFKQIKPAILNQLKEDFNHPIKININKKKAEVNLYDVLKIKYDKLEEKLKRCKNLYLEGIDTLEEFKENKKLIEDEKSSLEKQLISASKDKSQPQDDLSEFKLQAKNVYELLTDENISEDIKYTVVHELIEKIIYNRKENTLEIFYEL